GIGYAIFAFWLGPDPAILTYLPVLEWTAACALALALVTADRRVGSWGRALGIVLVLLAFPITRSNGSMDAITLGCVHVSTAVYVLAAFWFFNRLYSEHGPWRQIYCAFYCVVLSLAVFGDPLAIYIGTIPVMAWLIVEILQ